MSRTFKLDKYPYRDDEKLFTKDEITIEPGVTVLVGCNGSAKTTLLNVYIEQQLRCENIQYLSYNNLSDGGHFAKEQALHGDNDIKLLATLATSSEGEQIYINIGKFANKIGKYVKAHKDASEIWFLFDAIDSGLSIDNIIEIKDFFKLIIDTNPDTNIYIIVAANTYEMCRDEKCLDVRNCKYVTFDDYKTYRKFIIKTRELKDKRIK